MKYTKTMDVKDPTGDRDENCGIDFFVPNDWNDGKPYYLRMGEQINIPSGIKVKIKKTQGLIFARKSGVSIKKGIMELAKVIDAGYRGVIHINLAKVAAGSEDVFIRRKGIAGLFGLKERAAVINPGEKIIQGIIFEISNEPIVAVTNRTYNSYSKTARGAGAFGSTGTGVDEESN